MSQDVRKEAITFQPVTQPAPVLHLANDASGVSTAGYATTLRAGSLWQPVGTVPRGHVLRPLDTLLQVEGAHKDEAYLVTSGGSWVGFWLPVRKTYSPLQHPVAVSLH